MPLSKNGPPKPEVEGCKPMTDVLSFQAGDRIIWQKKVITGAELSRWVKTSSLFLRLRNRTLKAAHQLVRNKLEQPFTYVKFARV